MGKGIGFAHTCTCIVKSQATSEIHFAYSLNSKLVFVSIQISSTIKSNMHSTPHNTQLPSSLKFPVGNVSAVMVLQCCQKVAGDFFLLCICGWLQCVCHICLHVTNKTYRNRTLSKTHYQIGYTASNKSNIKQRNVDGRNAWHVFHTCTIHLKCARRFFFYKEVDFS